MKLGVVGVKKTVVDNFAYGGRKSRRPLGNGPTELAAEIAEPISAVIALEKSLKIASQVFQALLNAFRSSDYSSQKKEVLR